MLLFSLCFTVGSWLLQHQSALPDTDRVILLFPVALLPLLASRLVPSRLARWTCVIIPSLFLGFLYAACCAHLRLSDSLPVQWQGRDIRVIGTVAELPRKHPRGLGFAFDVEQTLTPNAHVPAHILLSTYDEGKRLPLNAGERWQFSVRLKRPHGTANPNGSDFEAWMLENGLRAAGYVRDREDCQRMSSLVWKPSYLIERVRERIREHFQQVLGDSPYAGVLIALAIGDQDSIPAEQWRIFTRTGVNHLMSISGLHITMLSGLAFWLAYRIWKRHAKLVLTLPSRKAASITGLLVATGYALLSGFSVPAQRTVYMLATMAAAQLLSRSIAPTHLLATALSVVLLLDPWAVMAPGFWLSFGAVGLIFLITSNRLGAPHWLQEYGRVQWAMSIGLMPLLLAMFQQVSLVSPLANALAIPMISFIVVPLTLLGVIVPVDAILLMAYQSLELCMLFLTWLNQLPTAVWIQHEPPAWSIVMCVAGILWCLLPSGFPSRWLGLLLFLPMFIVFPAQPRPNSLRILVFDIGQGLAVLLQTHSHIMLYDAGPDFTGASDSGNRIILPIMRARGIHDLDTLVLSHHDIDHIGGASSILDAVAVSRVIASFSRKTYESDASVIRQHVEWQRCMDGQQWEWDGIRFEMLHPSRSSYASTNVSDNNRGCVLSVSNDKYRILITADIEKESELRLMQQHADKLPADLLVVPHHGSATSSTSGFVHAVRPKYAIFTVGYRNRFRHPRAEVMQRYRDIGSTLFRSDEDGALQVDMGENGIDIDSYRHSHHRYWQQ